MKMFFRLLLPMLFVASCSEEGSSFLKTDPGSLNGVETAGQQGMMELGERLENPYSVRNVEEALASLYPTKAAVKIPANKLYVRFLPEDSGAFSVLSDLGIDTFDYPLDREIVKEGDYWHDPSVPSDEITWQYAVVPSDFKFPSSIKYEVLEECFIPEDDAATKAVCDVDWDAVERASYKLTGNADMLVPETRSKSAPSGTIKITDNGLKTSKDVGVSCVKVMANTLVRVSSAYTDEDGAYTFKTKFSAKPHYRICFKNSKGFTIGLNAILVPASVSDLGKGDPSGMDYVVGKDSDAALYRRCAVNNGAYDYIKKCEDEGIPVPPDNMRLWVLNIMRPSSTPMIHHGAVLDTKMVSDFLNVFSVIVRVLAPDITIGSQKKNYDYASLYLSTVHEMAHASHFQQAGLTYWDTYMTYVLKTFLSTGSCYGTGNGENAGYCEVGEMWAYFVESSISKEKYGNDTSLGSSWFRPEIFLALEKGGMTKSEICSVLTPTVNDVTTLKEALTSAYPSRKTLITQSFKKYSK